MDYSFSILILICVAIVQAIKMLKIKKAWLPFVSMIVGVILSFLDGTSTYASRIILDGMVIGLAGAGLFDFAKLSVGGAVKGIIK